MEDTQENQTDNISEFERKRAWIITVALVIVILTGLNIYTFITRTSALSFFDASPFRSELVWLGFIGKGLILESFLFLIIATSIFEHIPNWKSLAEITTIIGIVLMLLASILLFLSNNFEIGWMNNTGFVCQMIGVSMTVFTPIIQQKINKIAATIWNFTGICLLIIGATFTIVSYNS